MFLCMIDSKEEREVATEDTPGYFFQTDSTSNSTHLKLDGLMAELLAHIDPDIYRKYTATDEKGFKIMYAEYQNSLYLTLDSAILFRVKISTDLDRWGFKMNMY